MTEEERCGFETRGESAKAKDRAALLLLGGRPGAIRRAPAPNVQMAAGSRLWVTNMYFRILENGFEHPHRWRD